MFQRHLATTMLVSAVTGSAAPSFANSPVWESWAQPYQQQRGQFAPSRIGEFQPRLQQAAYHPPSMGNDPIQRGLLNLAQVLERKNPAQQTPLMGKAITNRMLAETVTELLNWNADLSPNALQSRFDLLPIDSASGAGNGKFTGYFTPELNGSRIRTAQFNIPVYAMPASNLASLSHTEIANGALAGRGLEIAWVDNAFALYVAQVQGAALIHFQDGSQSMINYAGSNNRPFTSVSRYLQTTGYKTNALSNADIYTWLQENPDKAHEVLTSNQRYIFFRETGAAPQTASGGSVIPGHTIAVDSHHIPHGSVLLAELPRFNSLGERYRHGMAFAFRPRWWQKHQWQWTHGFIHRHGQSSRSDCLQDFGRTPHLPVDAQTGLVIRKYSLDSRPNQSIMHKNYSIEGIQCF